jgi:hypothetical protein
MPESTQSPLSPEPNRSPEDKGTSPPHDPNSGSASSITQKKQSGRTPTHATASPVWKTIKGIPTKIKLAFAVIVEATKVHWALKLLWGVLAIASVVAIIAWMIGDLRIAVFGSIIVFIGLSALLAFIWVASFLFPHGLTAPAGPGEQELHPFLLNVRIGIAVCVVVFPLVIIAAIVVMLVTSVFFNGPVRLRYVIDHNETYESAYTSLLENAPPDIKGRIQELKEADSYDLAYKRLLAKAPSEEMKGRIESLKTPGQTYRSF